MKIRPQKNRIEAEYPTRRDYSAVKNSELLKLLAAVGISIGAVVAPSLDAEDKTPNETVTDSADKINLEISKLVANLGHQDYKTRENATIGLIAMGNTKIKDKDGKEVCNTKMKEAVISALEKLKNDRDPEVKQRAKRVILALNPPKIDGNIPRLGGIVAPMQFD